ncbi:MAG: phospholipase D family protein [Butyrivibrio sp.]|uniref:phospholipase D family protein n=1 Tax=Butyrivibrio sp. TaxID=28121 RepID=UPI0025F711F4|nr:phospholipase D family protein [Butyrivibrio sp.]MCR5772783.1 phospholipase D family protein [Butyrivibrio sp.]
MFKPTSARDRINYGEVLMPPVGYKLEHAIGTTYSLDLETLTAVAIALGLIEDTDSELISNPISMLSALQKISDRIIVFCEAGQIKLPSKPNALCLTLEKMVVPVSVPYDKKIKRFPAFHPKTWLLEYSNEEGKKKYRFVVMSRNMTFDHSWDVACALDGDTSSSGEVSAEPIVEFLKFLKKQLNKDLVNFTRQNNDIAYMIKTILQVNFQVEDGFSECVIMPLGIGSGSYDMAANWLFTENFHELVVMSPFLTGSVIAGFNNPGKTLTGTTRTLITRRSELPKIADGKASNFDVYVMKDDIIDGESSISDGEEQFEQESGKQDIHAKIYVRRKYNTTDLYLGSMNASYAAINSNVEMMLRLRTKNSLLNGEKFLDDIMGDDREGKKNPFELVSLDDIDEIDETSVQDSVEQMIKKICRIKMSARVEANSGKFDVRVSVEIDCKMDGVVIRPLRSNKESELLPDMEFNSLEMLQLSEFYVVSATIDDCTLDRVIMIPTSGIPEGRDAEIIKNVIKTKNQFIEYVAFILGDDYVQSFLENKKSSGEFGEWEQNSAMPAVYEKMLKTSVSDPERLGEIQYITKAIEEEEIIPPEFREMYEVFCNTLGIKQV